MRSDHCKTIWHWSPNDSLFSKWKVLNHREQIPCDGNFRQIGLERIPKDVERFRCHGKDAPLQRSVEIWANAIMALRIQCHPTRLCFWSRFPYGRDHADEWPESQNGHYRYYRGSSLANQTRVSKNQSVARFSLSHKTDDFPFMTDAYDIREDPLWRFCITWVTRFFSSDSFNIKEIYARSERKEHDSNARGKSLVWALDAHESFVLEWSTERSVTKLCRQ